MDAYYLPDPANPNRFESTELTRGPWSPHAQHAGPPSALLAHVIERCEPRDGFRIGRIAVEILGPVPIAPLTVEARVVRPGRSVEMLEATLSSDQGPVLKATAWRLRQAEPELELPPEVLPTGGHPGPETGNEEAHFPSDQPIGYHTSIDFRFLTGDFAEPGPAVCWFRLRQPIVAGTSPSPWERTLAAADAASGVSATLDWGRYLFINTDLTVTLHREPVDEWICLDAVTYPDRGGIGLAESRIYDEKGAVGRSVQTLLLANR